MVCSDTKLNDGSFQLRPKKSRYQRFFFVPNEGISNDHLFLKNQESFPSSQKISDHPEVSCNIGAWWNFGGSVVDGLLLDVWETVSQIKFSNLRTWESIGNPDPTKELPFLCESSNFACSLIQSLNSLKYAAGSVEDNVVFRYITQEMFVKDVKHVLGKDAF